MAALNLRARSRRGWRRALFAVIMIGGPGFGTPGAAIATADDNVANWSREIAAASQRFGLPAPWIERVMRAESRGRTLLNSRPITSSAGAMGLMQLMPGTWKEMRLKWRLGSDPHFPPDNIIAGAAYLREMYDRFGYPGLFAAYNAGPGRYEASLTSGRPLPAETRDYLAQVAGGYAAAGAPIRRSKAPSIFVAVNTDERSAPMARGMESSTVVKATGTVSDRQDLLFVLQTVR